MTVSAAGNPRTTNGRHARRSRLHRLAKQFSRDGQQGLVKARPTDQGHTERQALRRRASGNGDGAEIQQVDEMGERTEPRVRVKGVPVHPPGG